MVTRRRLFVGLVMASMLAVAPAAAAERLPVVASFSILGDLVRQVGGDRLDVAVLVGPDGDAHTYQPTPGDARRIAGATLVFVNGLGFEGWMPRLVEAAGASVPVVEAAARVAAKVAAHEDDAAATDDGHGRDAVDGHDHGGPDPHVWQSVGNARLMVETIRDALVERDPEGAALYRSNAAAYLAALAALDQDIRRAVAAIPEDRRRIITSHDAFAYFARAYGITFIAPQGVSTEAEASARAVAAIIRQIRAEQIPAVFVETISDPRLIRQIAEETGARIGGKLYSDALSRPEEGAGTYINMMRHNIRELAGALAS
jgi:zinc/manganese transport system substrate-binding protein